MSKIAIGVVAIIIILGLIAGVLLLRPSNNSATTTTTPPTTSTYFSTSASNSVTNLVASTTSTSTSNTTTSTTNSNENQPVEGSILYEIVAPYSKNATIVWLVMNIIPNPYYPSYVFNVYLNGNISPYLGPRVFKVYPLNAPQYSYLSPPFNPPRTGWMAYIINGSSSIQVKYATLQVLTFNGRPYNVTIYPAPNFTVLYADKVVILNDTIIPLAGELSTLTFVESEVVPSFYAIVGKNATFSFGLTRYMLGYNYVTVLNFSSPYIEAYGLPMTSNPSSVYVTFMLKKYLPYPVYTYIYIKWVNNSSTT